MSQMPTMPPIPDDSDAEEGFGFVKIAGWVGGLGLLAAAFLSPPVLGLSPEGSKVALLCFAMALLWITEGLPIPATALLPIVMLPLLGVSTVREAAAPYADPIIYLFMGGFMLSIAMARWNLHRRIALRIIRIFGTKPRALVLGFLVSATCISFGVSNSATAMMLLPIALSVYALIKESQGETASKHFGAALVLTVAYGANIGGMAILTSTPPNLILKGYMEKTHGIEVSFFQWMKLGIPLAMISLPLVYFIITRYCFKVVNTEVPGLKEALDKEVESLGPITKPELAVLGAFILAVTCWVSREWWKGIYPNITDEVIAIGSACLLFLIPVNLKKGIFILDWESVKKLPWGVLVIFGGGLSLASSFEKTKLAVAMASALHGMAGWPPLAMVFLVVAIMIAATAVTSNTATAAAFLPVIGALAVAIDQPVLLLAVPVAIAASADFMLPVGTPPNAIAYGSGLVSLPEMMRAGFRVNILFAILIPILMWTVGRWAFGI
ncbi:MAG: DASS family sodium-coupled anion symporter [Akkermansiaceae bacterium]|nr:DASS family sodium-coupled anion symporter [Akkermansiaceae bacterium]